MTNQGFFSSNKKLQNTRTGLKHRYQTARNQNARTTKASSNPYISDMYKEKALFTASNAYHRLDKSQNFMGNKAFAQTIINDIKQKQRQNEFENKIGLQQELALTEQREIYQKKASREIF